MVEEPLPAPPPPPAPAEPLALKSLRCRTKSAGRAGLMVGLSAGCRALTVATLSTLSSPVVQLSSPPLSPLPL